MKIKFSYSYDGNLPVITHCEIEYKGKRLEGEAICNTKYDFPNKKVGRKIAFTKAIQSLPREKRAELWNYYKLNFNF